MQSERPEYFRAVDLIRALSAVLPEGTPMFCDQTGGGTATLYVGRCLAEEGDAGPVYQLTIGPGVYEWSDAGASEFLVGEAFIVIGDSFDGEYFDFETIEECAAIAKREWKRACIVDGARVRLVRNVDRYPHFVAPAGATGTVKIRNGQYDVLMDEPIPGCEEWENHVAWDTDVALLCEDVEIIDGEDR
jgi:hypothetical protein